MSHVRVVLRWRPLPPIPTNPTLHPATPRPRPFSHTLEGYPDVSTAPCMPWIVQCCVRTRCCASGPYPCSRHPIPTPRRFTAPAHCQNMRRSVFNVWTPPRMSWASGRCARIYFCIDESLPLPVFHPHTTPLRAPRTLSKRAEDLPLCLGTATDATGQEHCARALCRADASFLSPRALSKCEGDISRCFHRATCTGVGAYLYPGPSPPDTRNPTTSPWHYPIPARSKHVLVVGLDV